MVAPSRWQAEIEEKLSFLVVAPSVGGFRHHAQVPPAITATLRQWASVVYLARVSHPQAHLLAGLVPHAAPLPLHWLGVVAGVLFLVVALLLRHAALRRQYTMAAHPAIEVIVLLFSHNDRYITSVI